MLNPEKPFSFGITIGHLAARSTDHKWVCDRHLFEDSH